jgi:hypothetical protein
LTQLDSTALDGHPRCWVNDQYLFQGELETGTEVSVPVRALIFVAELAFERPPGKPHRPVVEAVKAMCEPDVNIQRQR